MTDVMKRFGMHFLERPINLVLACYIYMTMGSKALRRVSRTELFSQIVVKLLMMYTVKMCPCEKVSLQRVLDFFTIENSRLTG